MLSKKDLSEQEIRSQYIYPALIQAGWDSQSQIREAVSLTAGRIYVKGRITTRGSKKQADYIL
jgi:type I restriction enzyme R subunit